MPRRTTAPRATATLLLLLLPLLGCSVNPATGQRQLMLISEDQEIEIGRLNDQEVVDSYGLYPDEAWQQFVQRLGKELASRSERPDLPWSFKVVDDPVVNAFALPGGFVYVTRGILAHFDSEAELAGVLGHEIGHVTARHGANQMSKAQLGNAVIAGISAAAPKLSDLAQLGGGLLFLKFSRDDERQADDLGLRYLDRSGYPPQALPEVFTMLERVGEASGEGRLPAWQSTHPAPDNRRERIQQEIRALPTRDEDRAWHRDDYLRRLQGLVYGRDPREGFFRDGHFYHPGLAFQLDFPEGWKTQNLKEAVVAKTPGEDAYLQLRLSSKSSPREALSAFLEQEGVEDAGSWRVRSRDRSAVARTFRYPQDAPTIAGGVAYFVHRDKVFGFLAYAKADSWDEREEAVTAAVNSFAPLTDPKILGVEPMRLDIVTLDRPMTVEELYRRYPSVVSIRTVGVLNQVGPGTTLEAGRLMKRVVGFNPGGE